MEPKKVFNLDLVVIENTAHVRDIVVVNESLFHANIMNINKDDSLEFGDKSQSNSEIINNNVKLTGKW